MIQEPQPHDADQQFCISCGSRLEPSARFCGICGAPATGGTGQPVDLANRGLSRREYMGFWIHLVLQQHVNRVK
jgi:predicted amidophosphoribosyltransferase